MSMCILNNFSNSEMKTHENCRLISVFKRQKKSILTVLSLKLCMLGLSFTEVCQNSTGLSRMQLDLLNQQKSPEKRSVPPNHSYHSDFLKLFFYKLVIHFDSL
jgi:hypothetical protein